MTARNLFVFIVSALAFVPGMQAQNLPLKTVFFDGYVLDSLDTKPIANVAIQLMKMQDDTTVLWTRESVSNRYGQFSFQLTVPDTQVVRSGDYRFTAVHGGYLLNRIDMPEKPIKTVTYEAFRGTIYLTPKRRQTVSVVYTMNERAADVRFTGLVLDSASNKPLQAAQVKVFLGKKMLFEARTREDGGFMSGTMSMTPSQADSLTLEVNAKYYRVGKTTKQFAAFTGKGSRYFSESKPLINFTALMTDEKDGVQLVPVDDK